MKIRFYNLLSNKQNRDEFKNFNFIPFCSIFWDKTSMAINIGAAHLCLQLSIINPHLFMEQKPTQEIDQKSFFQKFFGKLISFCFALLWLMVIFKSFNLSFMKDLSWWTLFCPMIFFLVCSLSYIIILYAWVKWFKVKPRQLLPEEEQLNKRRGHLRKKPTRIKDGLVKAIVLFLSILLTYFIFSIWA